MEISATEKKKKKQSKGIAIEMNSPRLFCSTPTQSLSTNM